MKCPICNTEAVITDSRNVFSLSEGKLYREAEFSCRNKKCANFGKSVGKTRTEVPVIQE